MRSLGKIAKFWVRGLTCAPATPFKSNGDLNLSVLPAYVQKLADSGVSNLFVNGTAGEGNNMTMTERKMAGEAWVKESKGKLDKVILHIGAGNIRESQELARHAEEIGADAIACVSPTYYKPPTLESYIDYMKEVAASAPNTPFLLYDIDFFTNVHHSVERFFALGCQTIPTLRGTKHTSPDFASMRGVMKHNDVRGNKVQVLMGTDDLYLQGLAVGLDETIHTSLMAPVLSRLKDAFDRGDMEAARLEENRAHEMGSIRRRMGAGLIEFGKAAVAAGMGIDVGPPRLPLKELKDEQKAELRSSLEAIGYFSWGTSIGNKP